MIPKRATRLIVLSQVAWILLTKLLEALKDAGVEAKHAEAIADAIVRNRGELATKTDVNWLKWGLGINIVLTICSLTIVIALLVNQLEY